MKKRANLKLNFKKERIAKLSSLQIIKGGDETGDYTTHTTDPKICMPTLVDC